MPLKRVVTIPAELFELATKEFDMNWTTDQVTVNRFLGGDSKDLERDSMKIKGNISSSGEAKATVDIDPTELYWQTILRGVDKAPWAPNNVSIARSIPRPVLDWIHEQITEFNTLSVKKKTNSGTTSTDSGPVETPKSTTSLSSASSLIGTG